MAEVPPPVRFGTADGPVLDELAVSVFLNGRFFMAAMTVPDRLPDRRRPVSLTNR